jgi:hypothetical protein
MVCLDERNGVIDVRSVLHVPGFGAMTLRI